MPDMDDSEHIQFINVHHWSLVRHCPMYVVFLTNMCPPSESRWPSFMRKEFMGYTALTQWGPHDDIPLFYWHSFTCHVDFQLAPQCMHTERAENKHRLVAWIYHFHDFLMVDLTFAQTIDILSLVGPCCIFIGLLMISLLWEVHRRNTCYLEFHHDCMICVLSWNSEFMRDEIFQTCPLYSYCSDIISHDTWFIPIPQHSVGQFIPAN